MLFWALGAGWLSAPLLHLAQRGFEAMGGGTRYDREKHLVPKRDAFTRIVVTAELYND